MGDTVKDAGNRSQLKPEGWHTITPRIVVRDTKGFVEFLKQVFDATGEYVETRPSVVTEPRAVATGSAGGVIQLR